MPKMIEKEALILRFSAGAASDDCGVEYELSNNADGSTMVKSSKTGRTFAVSWRDVLEMAIQAGINDEPEGT